MPLCILAAAKTTMIAATAFTLSWTHSVEKIQWEENWQVVGDKLQINDARVQGSGAGMDPPEGSVFKDGWWVYRPELPPLPKLLLARSGATVSGWKLCAEGMCREIGMVGADTPIEISACEADD